MRLLTYAGAGAVIGFLAVTIGSGLTTGSNISPILGFLFGIPLGAMSGIQVYRFRRPRD